MMSSAKKKITYTYQDLLNWEDDNFRHEIMEGDHVMTPSPGFYHQKIALNIASALKHYVEENNLGQVFIGPVDIVLSDIDVLVPDIGFVSNANREIIGEKNISGPPDLVIEIISPSTVRRDKEIKYKRYASYGVKEYWIVDPDKKSIAVHDLDKVELVTEVKAGKRLSTPVLPELDLDLEQIF